MYKLIFAVLISLVFCSGNAHAYSQSTIARQAIIVDFETGQVLLEKNAHDTMPTSSMSKVMTMLMVFDALENGRWSLDKKLPVSEKAWRMGGSKMFVEVGDQVKIEDLIKGVLVQSGNDATIVLAENLSGSEENFAKNMTQRAQSLGMKNSNFKNASGWPDPNHYSTAYDLSILAREILTTHKKYYPYFSIKEFEHNGIAQKNRNPLLYGDSGADGMKTGHTQAGKYGLIASGEYEGRRIIAVFNGIETARDRARESGRLVEWGLRAFENKQLFKAGESVSEIDIAYGQSGSISVGVTDDILVTLYKAAKNDLNVEVSYTGPIQAPVMQGQELAKLNITLPGGEKLEYPLVAQESVEEVNLALKTLLKVKTLFSYLTS